MTRNPERIVAAMAATARLAAFDDDSSWYDALFEEAGGRSVLARPDLPDGALLAALARRYAALDEHAATLAGRTHVAWLEEILGIPRLPVLPDRVVAQVTVDPKLAPAVVARGTTLRGGKDAFGNERHYRTLDSLTAHGAPLIGVRTLYPGGSDPGRPGIANQAPAFPLTPSAGPDAVHTMRIYSPALAFDGGDLTIQLTFGDATGMNLLKPAVWRHSLADGGTSATITTALVGGTTGGTIVRVKLLGGCGAPDGGTPWIECVIPASVPVPETLAFSTVDVEVVGRSPFVPQAAFYNDGAVDVTKEFQPFGAAAKRGDAFYLRSDEAFAKALKTVTITVSLLHGSGTLSASAGGSGIPAVTAGHLRTQLTSVKTKVGSAFDKDFNDLLGFLDDAGDPKVVWQRRVGGQWTGIGDPSRRFGSIIKAEVSGGPGSERFALAGQEGHYVRAFLSEGDFGWTAYQEALAAFATRAVAGGTPKPTMPTPPVPPIASAVTISYTTTPLAATRVESRSGWRHAVHRGGTFRPFRRPVSDTGATGMVAIGLDLPATSVGSSVSLYFDVDSASPCGATDPVDAHWQWWDGATWQDLAVADGTRQLRESGLLRYVVPPGSAEGCDDVSAATGRWVRLVTTAPERLGTLRGVHVDAVLAEFVSAAPDPRTDPSPATALPPGTIKGTLSPLRGVKKVTNLASVRGRGPEPDPAYRARASSRARHRNRAVLPWDYEQQVALAFPEVATVLCLPHTNSDGAREAGTVGLVVLPDRPLDPAPRPSVSLAERIIDAVAPARPLGARIAVLCPLYAPATVVASITLRRGVAALTGKEAITAALEAVLHPDAADPARWGRSLYASTLISFLERQPAVDVVTSFELRDASGAAVEVLEVDPCRGLYCSSAAHELSCTEQL